MEIDLPIRIHRLKLEIKINTEIIYKLDVQDRIDFEFQIHLREVILDENDVAKALLDYINTNYINNIVVGASTRNALTRFH